MQLAVGSDIGPYRILRLLGRGGMAAVYEVEHRALGVHYALKAFSIDSTSREVLLRKFNTEGKILARLRHPRLVRVYDLGVDEATGMPYFAMDLVLMADGSPRTLADLCASRNVTEPEIAGWYADICEGLAAIHAAGVIHRDLKLENVLLSADGHVAIADLGISRLLATNQVGLAAVPTLTSPSADGLMLMGSGCYIAPEVRGKGGASFASDYYALGVLVFRLLTGVWYEPHTNVMMLLSPFDPAWATAVAALTADRPEDRRVLPVKLAPPGSRPRARAAWARRRGVWWAAAVLLLSAALAALFLPRPSPSAARVALSPVASNAVPRVAAKIDCFDLGEGVTLEMASCRPSVFWMGNPDHASRPNTPTYPHEVEVTYAYQMGVHPVTAEQWRRVMGGDPPLWNGIAARVGPKMMIRASFDEAKAFARALTDALRDRLSPGLVFRLPTEAEFYNGLLAGNDPTNPPFFKLLNHEGCVSPEWWNAWGKVCQKKGWECDEALSRQYGFTYAELAAQLGVPEGRLRANRGIGLPAAKRNVNAWGISGCPRLAEPEQCLDTIDASAIPKARETGAVWGGIMELDARNRYCEREVDPYRQAETGLVMRAVVEHGGLSKSFVAVDRPNRWSHYNFFRVVLAPEPKPTVKTN